MPEDFKQARDLYTGYVKQVANNLVTMKQLLQCDNFCLIIRALDNNVSNLKGFRVDDFAITLGHIYRELRICAMVGEIFSKEPDMFANKLDRVSTRMFSSGERKIFIRFLTKVLLMELKK